MMHRLYPDLTPTNRAVPVKKVRKKSPNAFKRKSAASPAMLEGVDSSLRVETEE